jgi:hydroxyacylglutathione hydrolase
MHNEKVIWQNATYAVACLPALQTNYIYVLYNKISNMAAIIDPGEAPQVLDYVKEQRLTIEWILLTHHHPDHIKGAEAIRSETTAKIIGAGYDAYRLPPLDTEVKDNSTISILAAKAQVIHIPGHTNGHIAYYFQQEGIIFCGDTLFALGCGRLFEGTPQQLYQSLHKLIALDENSLFFCGHEYAEQNAAFAMHVDPHNHDLHERVIQIREARARSEPFMPVKLVDEKKTNPFLRAPSVEAFAALRRQKDQWS